MITSTAWHIQNDIKLYISPIPKSAPKYPYTPFN